MSEDELRMQLVRLFDDELRRRHGSKRLLAELRPMWREIASIYPPNILHALRRCEELDDAGKELLLTIALRVAQEDKVGFREANWINSCFKTNSTTTFAVSTKKGIEPQEPSKPKTVDHQGIQAVTDILLAEWRQGYSNNVISGGIHKVLQIYINILPKEVIRLLEPYPALTMPERASALQAAIKILERGKEFKQVPIKKKTPLGPKLINRNRETSLGGPLGKGRVKFYRDRDSSIS